MKQNTNLGKRILGKITEMMGGNKFNQAFLSSVGGGLTLYDQNRKQNYLEKGYNINSIVYSAVNQMAIKTASVPFYVRKIEDGMASKRLEMLEKATAYNMTMHQQIKARELKAKAYSKDELPFPMERPNTNQTWAEFINLYKTFLKTTGNAYIYILKPELRQNAEPLQVYLLPSHLTQIVVKDNVDLLSVENPIHSYIMTWGKACIEFKEENVIHIKYSNPNYDESGSHLYGLSPLKAALKNIQSSNEAADMNIKTLQNGGAFGFIHGKSIPLTVEQAKEVKNRLVEMKAGDGSLDKIAGTSAEIGFTRLSLTADEMKPFDYLKWDTKQIANVLVWSDKLLNNDEGAKYDNLKVVEKWAVVNNIAPDLKLLEEAMNSRFLPLFKGYENTCVKWDVMELPEMQVDMETLTTWLNNALDRGVINRAEYRTAINYTKIENPSMEQFTVNVNTMNLDDALQNDLSIE